VSIWLTKSEPTVYAFADLQRDGRTRWDGIRNPFARDNLRKMKAGDEVLYYHTGKEKAVVGLARVAREAYPEETDPEWLCVDLEPVRPLPRAVTLAEIKADKKLAKMTLTKNPRLSVQPVQPAERDRVLDLAAKKPKK
jgi:predicted RNA-binding protein with PUA-like domain